MNVSAFALDEPKDIAFSKTLLQLAHSPEQEVKARLSDQLVDQLGEFSNQELQLLLNKKSLGTLSVSKKMNAMAIQGLVESLHHLDASRVMRDLHSGLPIQENTRKFLKDLSQKDFKNLHKGYQDWPDSGMAGWLKKTRQQSIENFKIIDQSLKRFLGGSQVKIDPPSFQLFFNKMIDGYFARLPAESREKIMQEFLHLSPEAHDAERFRIVVQNCDPQFQKLLQTIAREEGLSPEFSMVLKELESQVKPLELSVVQEKLREVEGITRGRLILSDKPPLGSGTMAQVHEGTWNGKKVAIRVLRPGVEKNLDREKKLLMDMVPGIESDAAFKGTIFANFGSLLERVSENTKEELNIAKTIDHQKLAKESYIELPRYLEYGKGSHSTFHVPEVYLPETAPYGIMVQELVPGTNAERFFHANPQIKSAIVEDIAKLWIREALFNSGFFHADLHQGNILFEKGADLTNVYILDYGMSGRLDSTEKKALMNADIALQHGDTKKLQKALSEGLNIHPGKMHASDFSALLSKGAKEKLRIHIVLEKLISEGVQVSAKIVNFNRGMLLLESLLKNNGSSKTTINLLDEMGEKLIQAEIKTRFNPFKKNRELPLTDLSSKELRELMASQCQFFLKNLFKPAGRLSVPNPPGHLP